MIAQQAGKVLLAEEKRFAHDFISIVFSKEEAKPKPPSRRHLQKFAESREVKVGLRVDEQTVTDLELHAAIQRVFKPCSSGGHYLAYSTLLNGAEDMMALAPLKIEVRQHSQQLDPLLKPLRSCSDDPLPFLFLGARLTPPGWAAHLLIVPIIFLISLLLLRMTQFDAAGWLGIAVSTCAVAYTQIRLHALLISWKSVRKGICTILRAAEGLVESKLTTSDLPLKEIRKVVTRLERSQAGWEWLNEYLNLILLREYRNMSADMALVDSHIDVLRSAYLYSAQVDVLQALSSAPDRLAVPWADIEDEAQATPGELNIEGMIHPGMDLPLKFARIATKNGGAFISGQNAAGKSTLLRATGVNALFMRAFAGGFCTRCSGSVSSVISSITAADSMEDRESLYFAELRRCREILQNIEASHGILVLIDEPFRGTNYLESVSASASALDFIATRARTIVVTHNLALCSMLPSFKRFQVRRSEGVISVEPGVLADPNGLSLFDQVINNEAISLNARRWFEEIASKHISESHAKGTSLELPLANNES
ncbi:MutS-related protein [Roseateles sp. LKC17W]|uniref:DNA mismatch repair proteins mutS family domain-containing protein n=1 Tax=Pelomonas margarita TaxID=3299031 RepID=A0ABW7FQB0_9BURK